MERIFLSTPSARRATPCVNFHIPQEQYFYPRPPRGGRLGQIYDQNDLKQFLSTPSARRATVDFDVLFAFQCDFYPRPP